MTVKTMLKPKNVSVKRVSFDKDSAPYTCPELGRNPGLTDDRFEAFRLPSRIGNQYIYPKRKYD